MTVRQIISLTLFVAVAALADPPANDHFAARSVLGSVSGFSINASNQEATMEVGETDFGGIEAASVWYEWTAPSTGWVTITTAGSTLDSVIGVFTGNGITELSQVGFNDESMDAAELGTDHFSRLQFYAVNGTSYKISVAGWFDGFSSAEGAFTLTLEAVAPVFKVSGIALAPDPVDITNAAGAMAIQLTASTSLPGDVGMRVIVQPPGDLSRALTLELSDAQRVSGTAASGSYEASFALPRFMPAGDWTATVVASDGLRDTQWSYGGDAIQDDFVLPPGSDSLLNVVNTGLIDSSPPVLAALTASSPTVDGGVVAQAARIISFELQITDDLAGFDTGTLHLVGSAEELAVGTFSAAQRTSGDSADGVYTVTGLVPYGFTAGNYAIRVEVRDASRNSIVYSSEPGTLTPLPPSATSGISVTGSAGYPEWARVNLGLSGMFDSSLDVDLDGASNLAEYAFNLVPTSQDNSTLAPSVGTSGFPLITMSGGSLRIEFIRRKASANSGLDYLPQFSDTLSETGPGAWSTATGSSSVTSIDDTWERVIVTDTATGSVRRFARVKVVYTQQ